MKVNVYLSYFNGMKYIDEQIESLLHQKNVDVHIYIRDDGSKKDEATYLDKYINNDSITIIHAENLGYGKSFMWLVKNIRQKADFYAFCDQDDVWLDYKLETACKKISLQSGPVAYCALPKYVDTDLKPLENFHTITDDIHFGKMSVNDSLEYQLFGIGCTYVWNNKLNDVLQGINLEEYSFAHDNFFSILLPFIGVFIRDDLQPILYRQHNKNISGNKSKKKSLLSSILAKKKNFNNQSCFKIREYILEKFKNIIPVDKLEILKMTVCYRRNFINRFKLMKYMLRTETNGKKKMKNLLMVICNKY